MLINCPKCGFSQPKDRYCASCGVDMETYRPKPPPLLKQLMTSPVFLIAFTIAIVMSSVVYIRMKQKEELANRAALLRSGPVIVQQTPTTQTEASSEAQTAAAAPAPPAAAAPAPPAPPVTTVSAPASAAMMKTLASADEAKPTPSPGTAAKIDRKVFLTANYAEVSTVALEQMIEESQASQQFTDFGEFRAGALPNIGSRLGSDRGVKLLQKVSKQFDSKSFQQQWFVGDKTADGEEIGITTLVVLEPSADDHIRGQVEMLQSFYEEGDEIRKKTHPTSNINLPPKWGWFISVELPVHKQSYQEELGVEGLLSLFKSANFQAKTTKFALFLDFDTRSQ